MANKYIIHGATYNGDGTSFVAASSNGGVGAWNTITYFEGAPPAYGSLAAGDVVYIRSKTAAGADITVQHPGGGATVMLGRNGGGITWIVDAGAVWAGVSGRLTLRGSNQNNVGQFSAYADNIFCGTNRNLFIEAFAGDGYRGHLFQSASAGSGVVVRSAVFSNTMNTNAVHAVGLLDIRQYCNATFEDCLFRARRSDNLIQYDDYSTSRPLYFVGCEFELTADWAVNGTAIIFCQAQGAGEIVFVGGRVFGDGAVEGRAVVSAPGRGNSIQSHGLVFPRVMALAIRASVTGAGMHSSGSDGVAGIYSQMSAGTFDSRTDGYYPFLNAVRPDGVGFTLRIYPQYANAFAPLRIAPLMLFYTAPSAARTVTVEFLTNASRPELVKNELWFVINYIDVDGVPRTQSSFTNHASVENSDAEWSSTTYGPTAFNKRKITILTTYAIKSGTVMVVSVCMARASVNSGDVMFLDPDFQVT